MSNMHKLLWQQNLWRKIKDKLVAMIISAGGLSIIFMVVLMFVYLLYKALPLLLPAKIGEAQSISNKTTTGALYAGVNEYADILYQVNAEAKVDYWFRESSQQFTATIFDSSLRITAFNELDFAKGERVLALSDGSVVKLVHQFEVLYQQSRRISKPQLSLPWSEPLLVGGDISHVAAKETDDLLRLVTYGSKGLLFKEFDKTQSLLGDLTLEEVRSLPLAVTHAVDFLFINDDGRWLYVLAKSGDMTTFRLFETDPAAAKHNYQVTQGGERITQAMWLLGRQTLVLASDKGNIHLWFNRQHSSDSSAAKRPSHIRTIPAFADRPIVALQKLQQSRVILAATAVGDLSGYFASTGDHLFSLQQATGIKRVVANTSGKVLFIEDGEGNWYNVKRDDPHPEVSAQQLWSKIHYEGYEKPEFLWQSSASNQDFEPKYSLTPLVFGTIKAAFYAMLFAIPLAVFGAIYTAFFLGHKTRRIVKPAIEIMEALPTVILGFLAGLWMAPFVESHLLAILLCFIIVPVGTLGVGFFSQYIPSRVSAAMYLQQLEHRSLALIPWLLVLLLLAFSLAEPLQDWFFYGDFRHYVTQQWGIDYNQRNALVVGFVMGFAVIPTIFSITEDAIYSVPKHLVNGSLAMGASLWQTLARVVLPTASPGIFSAIMIGFGRAVGETMIVLMATGNTPVMSLNIFEGMRTLAANIAVEMPESAVDSSHFRILFLAALVLFMFTFFFNTLAETVRQRLKKKYAEL